MVMRRWHYAMLSVKTLASAQSVDELTEMATMHHSMVMRLAPVASSDAVVAAQKIIISPARIIRAWRMSSRSNVVDDLMSELATRTSLTCMLDARSRINLSTCFPVPSVACVSLWYRLGSKYLRSPL